MSSEIIHAMTDTDTSASIVHELAPLDMISEYWLMVFPIVLGRRRISFFRKLPQKAGARRE